MLNPRKTLAERHVHDLIQVLQELLLVPELCFEPDTKFDYTHEVMADARVLIAAIRDEWAERFEQEGAR